MLRYVLAALAAVSLSPAAQAVTPVTYTLQLEGFGTYGTQDNAGPPNILIQTFSSAILTFQVPDVMGRNFAVASAGVGLSELSSTTSGLSIFFRTQFQGFSGGGNVCFANPSGLLPTSPVTLTAGAGCQTIELRDQGRTTATTFTGSIKSFTVSAGDGSSSTTLNFSPTPEPATWGLMLVGFGAIGALARSRRTRLLTA